MHFIISFFQFLAHLDIHLQQLTANYGAWVYGMLFLIIFCETGLIIFPFLPGDSLLFAAGSVSAITELNPHVLFILLALASVLGDNTNYFIGRWARNKLQKDVNGKREFKLRFIKQQYVDDANAFYERHGGLAIILAKFVPIIRSFVPFVAGLAVMTYRRFFSCDIAAAIIWVGSLIYSSYLFGNIPFIKQNFSIIIYAIILISLLPVIISTIRHWCTHKRAS